MPAIRHVSETVTAPSLTAAGFPDDDWAPDSVVDEPYGRVQIVVEGVDITYLLDAPTPFPRVSRTEPFGSASASVALPQVTAFHRPGHGALDWCKGGANIDIRIKRDGDDTKESLFAGVLMGFDHDEDTGIFTLRCIGALFQGDLQLRPPAFDTRPVDIGTAVARALNAVVGRRYSKVDAKVTGCQTSVEGAWEPRLTGFVQQLLATAVTRGHQWTVACAVRNPELVKKNTSTVQWTIRNGQRGINVQLTRDWTQAPNVIYAEGVRSDGGRWRNAKYPNWRDDDTPEYPGPLGMGMTVGYRDAQTSSGEGVSVWQEKAGQPVTGVLSQADKAAWRRVQADAGITVDNYLGPQTWAATFQTGSNTGTLDGAYIAPVAASKKVQPYLYGPDGDNLGANPNYDPDVIRVERYINFGRGLTKARGREAAQNILARDIDPGWVGTITFTLDPREGSKYQIREGHNLRILDFRGTDDLVVHVSAVDYDESTVSVTVDTNARDYPTLDAILERKRNATDPALAYVKDNGQSRLSSDRGTWDTESPGGQVPRVALFGGLWTVLRIPFGAYGTIVKSALTTTSETPFTLAVFNKAITANQLVGLVGNPLSATDNPWQEASDALDGAGLLMAWGWKEQPCGYYPKQYKDPDGKTEVAPTGRMVDDSSWEYQAPSSPWLWVAILAQSSCFVKGTFTQGAD